MSHFEANKIAASVLTAALIALLCAQASRVLYRPRDLAPDERGFTVAAETGGGAKDEGPVLTFPQLLAAGSAENGAKIFKKCASCHDNSEGGPNKVGPNLWGIVGAKRARNATFAYSDAMKAKGGEWTYEEFQKFLKGPQAYINGTKMSFAGLKKEKDIADVVLFLRQNGSKDLPLPAADAPAKADEAAKPAEAAPQAIEAAKPAEAAPQAIEAAKPAEAAPQAIEAAKPAEAAPQAIEAAKPAEAAPAEEPAKPSPFAEPSASH